MPNNSEAGTPSPPPACALCRGACCESIVLDPAVFTLDGARWITYHGTSRADGTIELPCACDKLQRGLCSIHPTRPRNCVEFQVGGSECRSAIRSRRPAQQDAIEKLLGD